MRIRLTSVVTAMLVVTFALAVALFLTWRDARALSLQELRSLT